MKSSLKATAIFTISFGIGLITLFAVGFIITIFSSTWWYWDLNDSIRYIVERAARYVPALAVAIYVYLGYVKRNPSRPRIIIGIIIVASVGILISRFPVSFYDIHSTPVASNRGIKNNLSGIRVQAQLYYDEHGNYGLQEVAASITLEACSTPGTLFDPENELNANAAIVSAERVFQFSDSWSATCAISVEPPAWAISSPLNYPSRGESMWCVDSAGAAKEVSRHITEAKCPTE
jgi:hypothetical protein